MVITENSEKLYFSSDCKFIGYILGMVDSAV
jgi:hypothetical protein